MTPTAEELRELATFLNIQQSREGRESRGHPFPTEDRFGLAATALRSAAEDREKLERLEEAARQVTESYTVMVGGYGSEFAHVSVEEMVGLEAALATLNPPPES